MKLLILAVLFLSLNLSDNDATEMPPISLSKNEIQWYILASDPEHKENSLVDLTPETIPKYNLNAGKFIVYLFHGYMDGQESRQILSIGYAYGKMCRECNVILAKWKLEKNYNETVKKVPEIARNFSEILNGLIETGSIKGSFIFVGLGLGAHVAGIAAQHVKVNVLRVVGLNPSALGFQDANETSRISRLSGKLVEVVHTCAKHGLMSSNKYSIGHVDYYPNSGGWQPVCYKSVDDYCSHFLAAEYYEEAMLKPGSFMAVKCKDWIIFQRRSVCKKGIIQMGTLPPIGDNYSPGKYFLRTNKKGPPHGLGKEGLRFSPWLSSDRPKEKPGFIKKVYSYFKNIFG